MNSPLTVIFKYIQSYYNSTFKLAYFFAVTAMLSAILFLNYFYPPSLGPAPKHSWVYNFSWYYCLYLIPFATAFLLQYFFYNNTGFLKNKYFLALVLLAPAFFSFRVNFNFHHSVVQYFWRGDEAVLWLRCSDWIIKGIVLSAGAYFTWVITTNRQEPLYSITNRIDSGPYFILLLLMLPLILWVSVQHDFLQMYPRGQIIKALDLAHKTFYYLFFECSYALDFVSIEFFFRGFLIIAFIRICGMQCIVPAACFYCCIHLGKPMAEAISSFFGGLLLGIISYHTKSIRGCLIIHIGIAAMMELVGLAAHTFFR